jgi:putative membrane protein insertion efficiency factor
MNGLFSRTLIVLVAAYQRLISPFLPRCCRFYPSCSTYAKESIEKHGPWRGLARSIRRISRCHPWHPGGLDPVD